MDDESFKTELLNRLERIQSLLSYLCAAAKASEERAQAGIARQRANLDSNQQGAPERSLLQDEMQDVYDSAVQRWKSGKAG